MTFLITFYGMFTFHTNIIWHSHSYGHILKRVQIRTKTLKVLEQRTHTAGEIYSITFLFAIKNGLIFNSPNNFHIFRIYFHEGS